MSIQERPLQGQQIIKTIKKKEKVGDKVLVNNDNLLCVFFFFHTFHLLCIIFYKFITVTLPQFLQAYIDLYVHIIFSLSGP